MMFRLRPLLLGLALAALAVLGFSSVVAIGNTPATAQAGIHVSSTSVTPSSVSTLDVVTIRTTMASDVAFRGHLGVVMVVRDETGQTVLQEKQTGMSLSSGNDLSVYWEWRIPGRLHAGTYSVEMSVVDEGGNVLAVDANPQAFTVALPR